MKRIQILDSHTGGEPTRLVIGGFPDLGAGSMAERRERLAREHDAWRAATVLEPRGSDVVVTDAKGNSAMVTVDSIERCVAVAYPCV